MPSRSNHRSNSSFLLHLLIASGLGFGLVYAAAEPEAAMGSVRSLLGPVAGCAIKGNVSISGGERIYHLPGQRYYGETTIRTDYGERFFCSEAEARAAGWRRSRV